ncbi:hypothetical protein D3C85_1428200 [compost metagenome]
MRLASSKVNGSISLRERFGISRGAAGLRSIIPSATAAFKIVDILTSAFLFTPEDVHFVPAMMRRSWVVVIRSMLINAKWGIQ